MSQAGIVDIEGSHPQIPTLIVANVGTAIPIGNTLEVLGTTVAAHGVPLQTVGSGNMLDIEAQYASAAATSIAGNAGFASFNSADFTVDANGFVTLSGSGPGLTITGNSGGPLSPVAGNWNIYGSAVAAGSSPVATAGSGNTLTVNVQTAQAIASTSATNIGLAAFNSAEFTVDANGFVSLTGGVALTFDGDSGTATPSAGVIIISGGTTGLTTSASGHTVSLTGTLKLGNGGTNAALTASNGGIFYSTATAGAILSGTSTADQVLLSGSSTAPAWSTATYPATTTINQILYSSSNNAIAGITAADNGVLISGTTGIPSWLANSGTPGYVLTANSSLPPSWQSASASGAITTIDGDSGSMTPTSGVVTISGGTTGLTTSASGSTMDLTGTLKLANGGTNASLSASNGGIFYSTSTAGAILSGTATANLPLLSGSSTSPSWSGIQYVTSTATNDLIYASSSSALASLATVDGGLLTTSNTGAPTWLAAGSTSGIPLIAQGASTPPVYGSAVVAGGGTGNTSFTAYSVLCAGTTSTGAFQNVSGVGTAGQVLTSNGASALPTWQDGGSVLKVTNVAHSASPYTVLSTDQFLAVNVSGGVVTITLPNAPTTGRVVYIKDTNGAAATSNISVTTVSGTVTIDGQTTYTMATNYQSISVIFDGNNYEVF